MLLVSLRLNSTLGMHSVEGLPEIVLLPSHVHTKTDGSRRMQKTRLSLLNRVFLLLEQVYPAQSASIPMGTPNQPRGRGLLVGGGALSCWNACLEHRKPWALCPAP